MKHPASTRAIVRALGLACALLTPAAAWSQAMTWNYEYDALGNLTKITDPRGIATDYVYDALSRRTQIKQPAPATGSPRPQIDLGYDGQAQLKTVTDPRSLSTTYTTDGLGNTTTQASPDTGNTTQTVNAAGLITTRKDARNVTATHTYDALNRLTKIVYAGTGFTTLTDTYVYDQGANGIGRLTKTTYSGGNTSWTYDGFGRMDSMVQTLGSRTLKVQKTYDAAGRLATLTYPSGKVLALNYVNGQPDRLTLDGVPVASNLTTTPFGALASWTWGNGRSHTRSYDLNGRLTDYPLGPDTRTLAYDDAGRITAVTHTATAALNQSYGYDDLDRLTQVTATTDRSYAYDATGNRTQAVIGGLIDTYSIAATSNRLTGIAGGSAKTYTYDAMGNTTGDGTFTATYDARGRLAKLTQAAVTTTYTYDAHGQRIRKTGGPAGTVIYVYDDAGHLLGEYTSNGNAKTEYVWLGDMPLAVLTAAETLKDNGTTSTTYVGTWGTATTPVGFYGSNYRTHPAQAASPDSVTWNLAVATGTYKVYARWPANSSHSANALYRVTHAAGSTDVTVNQQQDGAEWVLLGTFSLTSAASKVKLIPQADGAVAADAVKAVKTDEANRIYFIHADHLNAPRAVLDTQNRLRWRWVSDPFGLLPPETNPQGVGAFTLNLRLPGQVYDLESALHYNYFRDYDPATGRYIESDPIGLKGGINTYAYVGGRPVSFTDPSGLITWKGWARSLAIDVYLHEEYDLTSDCICGKKVHIKVIVTYGGPSAGAIAQNWYAEFTDPFDCPNPLSFEGLSLSYSAGVAVGWGFGYSRTRIGMAESVGWSVIRGLGASVGVASGFARVEVLDVTLCDECSK
jgi:RHS repeat-associated protein